MVQLSILVASFVAPHPPVQLSILVASIVVYENDDVTRECWHRATGVVAYHVGSLKYRIHLRQINSFSCKPSTTVSKNVSGNRRHPVLSSSRQATAELSLTAVGAALALPGVSPAMAAPNKVTGYDPEGYLKDMIRVWRGRKNAAVASRDARAPAAKQHEAAPRNSSGGRRTPRIEKADIILVLKPRETLDLKATFGPGQAGAAVRSILGADASVGLAVWAIWDQNVLVCTLKSVDATERLLRDITMPVGGRQLPFRGHLTLSVSVRKLGDTPVAVITCAGTKVPRTVLCNYERLPWAIEQILARDRSLAAAQAAAFRYLLLLTFQRNTNAFRAATSAAAATRLELPVVLAGSGSRSSQDLHADRSRKQRGGGTNRLRLPRPSATWDPIGAPCPGQGLAALTPVQTQVSCWGWAVSGPSPSPSPTETALQQQIGELRRQNQVLARKTGELEAKQVASSEPVQEAEADDGDDGSSVTSRLTSVSRQDADTVVGPASITGPIGRLESLERKTEQLEARVAALPTQIMWAVRESFQDMFMAALTQALPDIVAQVSNSVLKAVQPWVSTQIKNTTQCDSPQLKRKPASCQAAEESFSGSAPGGPVRLLTVAAPAPGPDRSPAP
ncbi:hypothetical protein HPB50_018643 [Hyalomma asiaticum]|uniref:Uncharacterized protein n=1 Tax=Hyalomma asiaticum TaxID=266040 RepID=A0ACB7SXR2_HYAAI|nr:hypothetical protein HPB50_018643 [Hyalomma asiaticum]